MYFKMGGAWVYLFATEKELVQRMKLKMQELRASWWNVGWKTQEEKLVLNKRNLIGTHVGMFLGWNVQDWTEESVEFQSDILSSFLGKDEVWRGIRY